MKKFLLISGSFILFIIITATMFKLMHWPGAGPMFVIGITFFSVFFLPCFFIHRMITNKTGLSIVTNILALLTSFMIFMGVLFKLMHWPGAALMIIFGCFFFIFPTLILYVIQQFKEYGRKFSEFWRFVVMSILVCVFLIFWGSNVSRSVISSYLKVEDATLETNKNLQDHNAYLLCEIKAKRDSAAVFVASAEKIAAESGKMLEYIDAVKSEMISYLEPNPEAINDHWMINSLDNYDIPSHFLCGPGGKGAELHRKLDYLKGLLKEEITKLPLDNKDSVVAELGDLGIHTELKPQLLEGFENWEDGMFYQQTIAGSLALLSSIQNEVLNAEFQSLNIVKMNMK